MAGSNGFTPTQQRILAVLADGAYHPVYQLQDCLADELAGLSAVQFHVSTIRKKLRPKGEDIYCEMRGSGAYYRYVRVLARNNR